jgi:hypothetical protein
MKQLSIKTLIDLGAWVRLIRGLKEGENTLPPLSPSQWDILKSACYRENKTQDERAYAPSNKAGVIRINVTTL